MNPLFAFFGTSEVAVYVLDALEAQGLLPALIVTAPDRPKGRGLTLTPSPAKAWALERDIDVITPESLKGPEIHNELANTDWDLFVVASYGKIIPKSILDLPRKGSLNVHPSLLPKFRGPSPIMSAILADERETGVTIMLMDEEMDHGPILAQARIEIDAEDWPMRGRDLEELLATEGGNLLAETIPQVMEGALPREEQLHAEATYTKKFTPEDARIDLSDGPYNNLLKIRTFDQNPRAHFIDEQGKRVIITDAAVENGTLVLLSVIPEGKKEMSYEEYLRSQKN